MRSNLHDLVIRNGKLIGPGQSLDLDLSIDGEKIAAVGQDLIGRRVIDAAGKYILPGGIDPHVHLEMPIGATQSSDDWFTGTRAAACGGTTTVIDFVEPEPGEKLEHALNARRELAQSKVTIDFGLHMTITQDDEQTLQDIATLCKAGCTSFKTYLTYAGFRLSDTAFLNVLCAVKEARGIVLVHAENDAIISHLQRYHKNEKNTAPQYHALTRPAIAEGEAIQRSLALAEVAGARVYIVHPSTALGVDAIRAARGRGVAVLGETCPQYLLLTNKELSRPGFEGAKFVCSPPLRSQNDNERLWKGLADDDLQTVGTDHCPFFFNGQKDLGKYNFLNIPGGLPGIESRLALIHQFGVRTGRLSLNRWVEVCCTNPARIFGLYPNKGTLEPGTDADLVLFDPEKKVTLTQSILHEQVDYTPYEGFELQGYPVMTILRG
ncbi:MAG TPA: dihydropyrimidinase, partial [Syntrophobacteraceae bacterium]|nr:dihydropyrimidinase [Syntrophobacteraceae bacterium]